MQLEDLTLFVETVRRGSLSQAARTLAVSQPTVSRRIQRLESELGQVLLDRSGAAVSPTPAGLAFLRFAERVLAQRQELRRELTALPDIAGEVAIAASTTPGEGLVPRLLAEFGQVHPTVRLHLHVMDSQMVENCVLERHCQLGFMGVEPHPGLCHFYQVAEDELCLALPASHELASQDFIRPDELLSLPFMERPPGSGTRKKVEEILANAGVPYQSRHIVMEMSSAHALLAAVATGCGVSFLPCSLIERTAGVRALRIEGVSLRRPIYLLHLDQPLPAPVEAFVRFVRSRAVQGDHAVSL